MSSVWTKEKAWQWYDSRPWMRGCNFMGSDCANRIDQWQEYGFEERLLTADRELALAAETGFNSIRIIPEFFVWQQDHDGFMERFDRYLATAWKHGISCMIVLGNDCMRPKSLTTPDHLGPQHYDWGYHGGRKISQHQHHGDLVGYHLMDEPELALQHYEWVREIITTHKDDPRICMWDLINEAGGARRDRLTMPHLRKFFEIAREVNPSQPLTSCVWRLNPDREPDEIERFCLENSDIISYHNYRSYEENILLIKRLKQYGRPIINTEWLARMTKNTVEEMFPLFYLEKIGCWNWGFVAGLYQTYEPWNTVWQTWENGGARDVDFKVWFHDLYRPSLHPYDPHETELIQRLCRRADEEFAREQEK